MGSAREVILAWVDAFNRRDAEAAAALYHDDATNLQVAIDEPLVGLDPRSARIVKDLFVSQARAGVAVLMSTHLLSIAEELADTIGIDRTG